MRLNNTILVKDMNLIKKESKFIVNIFIVEVSLNLKNFSKFIVKNTCLYLISMPFFNYTN